METPEVERVVWLILWGVTMAIFSLGFIIGLLF